MLLRMTICLFLLSCFAHGSQEKKEPTEMPGGWPLKAPGSKAVPVAVKVRLTGYYPVGSRIKDQDAFGFGPCDNYPFDLGEKTWGTKGKISLVAFPEEPVAFFKYRGIAVRLINRTGATAAFTAWDSRLYLLQEAQDESGHWREIESPPVVICGNSFHRVFLKPNQYWQFPAPLYSGSRKTKIRFRLDLTNDPNEGTPIYSNTIEGFVNSSQFRVGPDRAALGRALQSAKATPEVLATLNEALNDEDVRTRRQAAECLGQFGPAAKQTIPALLAAMKRPDVRLRAAAATALFAIDNQPKYAIDTLIAVLETSATVAARQAAVLGIRHIGARAQDAVSAMCVALLKEKDYRLRATLAETLGTLGCRADLAVPALVQTLEDVKWFVRSSAAEALGQFGPDAKKAVPALSKALKDTEGHVKVSASHSLWRIEGKTEPVVRVLIDCLEMRERHDYVPDAAAEVLASIGPPAKSAIPGLTKLIDKGWRGSRIVAAAALWKITNNLQPTMTVFLKELQDPELHENSDTDWMFRFLEVMGPQAKDAIPALRALLQREPPVLREEVAKLLKKIGG